jgi:hypothetical protein
MPAVMSQSRTVLCVSSAVRKFQLLVQESNAIRKTMTFKAASPRPGRVFDPFLVKYIFCPVVEERGTYNQGNQR